MSNEHHNSPAYVEARLSSLEEAFGKLVLLIEGQTKILNMANMTLGIMEQRQSASDRTQERHSAKLELLQDTRSTMKGGWMALTAIGTVLVVLSSVIGALVAWLAFRNT